MPRLESVVVECYLTPREKQMRQIYENDLVKRLIEPSSGRKKPKWSLAIQRRLQLLAASLHLFSLDKDLDIRAGKTKQHLEDPNIGPIGSREGMAG